MKILSHLKLNPIQLPPLHNFLIILIRVVEVKAALEPVDLTAPGCTDSIEFDAGDICIEGFGRIVRVSAVLREVCPGRRIALAVILNEVDDEGNEFGRGMKVLTVPAFTGEVCRDVNINCVTFVIPDLPDNPLPPCADRTYRARFIANYIDTDFTPCCPDEATP